MAFDQWRAWLSWELENCREAETLGLRCGWGLKLLAAGVERNRVAVVGKSFRLWHAAASEGSRHDVLVQRIARRWHQLGVSSCFSTWKEFSGERKLARKLAGRVFARVVHAKTASAWTTWVSAVVDGKRYRAVCEKAAFRLRRRGYLGAFLRWCDYVYERKHMRRLVGVFVCLCGRCWILLMCVCWVFLSVF